MSQIKDILSRANQDPWTTSNPEGFLSNLLAENKNAESLLESFMVPFAKSIDWDQQAYNATEGCYSARNKFAKILQQKGLPSSAETVVLGNGISSMLVHLLNSIKDMSGKTKWLIKSPYYFGFDRDFASAECSLLQWRKLSDLELVNLDEVAGILVVNPGNPIADFIDKEEWFILWNLAKKNQLYLVLDEVGADFFYQEDDYFCPTLSLQNELTEKFALQNLIYMMSPSKDIGMAGNKLGVCHCSNNEFLQKMRSNAYLFTAPVLVQRLLADFMHDNSYKAFCLSVRSKVRQIYLALEKAFNEAHIPFLKYHGGFTIVVDLSSYMKTWEEETDVWLAFVKKKLVVAPGKLFHFDKPGYFRCTIPQHESMISEIIARISSSLLPFKKRKGNSLESKKVKKNKQG